MSDEFHDTDLDTPTEADLDLAYGSKYLGTIDLGNRKVRARIQKVGKDMMTSKDGGLKRMKFIVFFDALDKPMVLNSTNKDVLVDARGRKPAKWVGLEVGVYVDPNVSFAGRRTGGLRLTTDLPTRATKTASKPAAAKPAPANEFPEEAGDPGFEADPNDSPDFDQAAE